MWILVITAIIILYVLVIPCVIWGCDSININVIFKKNRYYQARVFYIMIVLSLTYLVTNFLIQFLNCLK